ncbi:MAG: nucleotidyl transferase AbiEii/AbiGii toxin family protein [Mycobacterium sp.]
MSDDVEPVRTVAARRAAELALVRVVHHYGGRPEFVLLGGLVPALLCSNSPKRHAGTTDVDVQVNLEIAGGSVQATRLEEALLNAGFEPDDERVWRWELRDPDGVRATVKFELLADLDNERNNTTVTFTGCKMLGAANLRGTGYAARDTVIQKIAANDQGVRREAEIYVAGLAGFLLAKVAAAHGRRKEKDWYDLAFVLLHNDYGDAIAAAERVLEVFGTPTGEMLTQLLDLQANFAEPSAQGAAAYVRQFTENHPEDDAVTVAADGQLAVRAFTTRLLR